MEGAKSLSYTVSTPWHFNQCRKESVPFGDGNGIYIYSCPADSNWQLAPELNVEDVWYIGKSDGNIGGRVWSHVGLIYEPDLNRVECVPRFKHHQWKKDDSVPVGVRDKIASGNIVVYTVKMEVQVSSILPNALEKYLLATCVRLTGELPVLNKGL